MIGYLARSLRGIGRHFKYHLKDKWRFVYLEFTFDRPIQPLTDSSLLIRRIGPSDLEQVRRDLLPHLTGEQSYDTRYFETMGEKGSTCFVVEREGRLIHYSWVFTDIFRSPITKVPFDLSKLRSNDSYIGPVFTVPGSRGMTYLYVLPVILEHLVEIGVKRALVLVDQNNAAAKSFYLKFGFKLITDTQTIGAVSFVTRLFR